jgi:ribonucleoside-diphosphate reductase subunit M2
MSGENSGATHPRGAPPSEPRQSEPFHVILAAKATDVTQLVGTMAPLETLEVWTAALPRCSGQEVETYRRLFSSTTASRFARWLRMREDLPRQEHGVSRELLPDVNRHNLVPIRDPELFEFRKLIEKSHWIAEEVDLSKDRADARKLQATGVGCATLRMLRFVLGFFAKADDFILAGLDETATKHLGSLEARYVAKAQANQEATHAEAYGRQIEAVVEDERERADVFAAVARERAVAAIADWIRWVIMADLPPAYFFAAMVAVEGVVFSGFFAAIESLKTRNLFPGVTQLNEWIVRDEGVHTAFWTFLATKRVGEPAVPRFVWHCMDTAAELAGDLFRQAVPAPVDTLTAADIIQYVDFVAHVNGCAVAGEETAPRPRPPNPFSFMDKSALNDVNKTNFFEEETTAYQEATAMAFRLNASDSEDGD